MNRLLKAFLALGAIGSFVVCAHSAHAFSNPSRPGYLTA